MIWGVCFLFIKVAVHDMSPAALVLIRASSGFVALTLIMGATRRPLLPVDWKQRAVPLAVMAILAGLLPWALIAWGEERISSGLASILNATTPLWAAVLAYWVIPSERPSPVNYAGVVVGLTGVVILVLPKVAASGLGGDTLGTLAVLLAAVSYGVSVLFQRRRLRGVNPYDAALGQLAFTAVFAFGFALPTLPALHLDMRSMAAALFLGIAGSGVASLMYYYILNSLGPVRGSGVTLLVPLTAVIWGVILLHEVVTLPIVVGMIVILAGIVLTNLHRRQSRPVVEPDTVAA